jgi:colicin import membrane protein
LAVGTLRKEPEDYIRFGLSLSVVGHIIIAIVLLVKVLPEMGQFEDPIVYSISIEGGKTLGGISQVPKDDKPSPVTPLKNVAAQTEKDPPVVKPEPKKEQPPEEPVDDAEVSVADKKPTPQPTPQAPKPTPASKPTPKATAVPTKKPEAKKDTKTTPKSDGDEIDKRLQAGLQRYLGESTRANGQGFGAAKLGGAGMGGGRVVPPEVIAYQKLILARIREAWRWYDVNAALITQLTFDIAPDGVVRGVKIVKGSGNDGFDESVQRAIVKASPLPPPPSSVYEQYFKSVRITFDPRE